MAKKVVATLKTGTGKQFTKCIKMVKSDKTGAYMLNGASLKHHAHDDDFLIMASGDNYHTVHYTLPTPPSGGNWQLIFDTSESNSDNTNRQFAPGSQYALKPYSFVVMTRKKSSNIEHQHRRLNINLKALKTNSR